MRVGAIAIAVTLSLSCGGGPTDPGGGGPSEPVLETVEVTEGAEQVGSVGLPLDSVIELRAVNDDGSPAGGIDLTFAASGDGSVDPSTANTDADGRASVTWALATTPGVNELSVTPTGSDSALAVVTATGFADRPTAMALHDGDEQTELPGLALPAPIRVRLVDEFDNPVVGVPVEFSAAGGGTVSPEEALTDLDGVAASTWTLGPDTGPKSAQALVRDSAVYDIVDLPGSPVSFTATAVSFGLDGVSPEPAAEGDTLTLAGSGFGPDDPDNEIRIDGQLAPVVETTQTSITVEVPTFGCEAARTRPLEITRGTNSATANLTVHPADALELAPGERTNVTDPADYCLQFLESSGSDPTEYLVGLTSTREWNASASFTVTAADVSTASTAPALSSTMNRVSTLGTSSDTGTGLSDQTSPEGMLREWERSFLATSPQLAATDAGRTGEATLTGFAMAPPVVGDDLSFRVPRVVTDPCNDYSTREVTVVHVGTRVVVAIPHVPDLVLSTLLGNTTFQNAVSELGTLFDDAIYPRITEYVGEFQSADDDGLATIVLSPAWNSTGGPPVFSAAADLVARETCPASDEEVIVYVTTPDLDYSSLSAAVSTLAEVMEDSGTGVAHELTHVVQNVRRIEEGIVQPLPAWLAEGHAEMLVEVVGRSLRGDAAGMDYGSDVVNADEQATAWYLPRFERLSYFFGWDGASAQVEGAPAQCSLYGFGGTEAPCDPAAAPGAAWSFVRYLGDRVGSDFAGGESGLSREMTVLTGTDAFSELVQTATGSDLARLVVDWAAALYADGRLAAEQAPELQVESWNLADIFGNMTEPQRLQPDTFGFQGFTLDGSVVGGGTAYLRIAAPGAHGSLALKVRDPLDRPLSSDVEARLWVLRLQ